MSWKGEVGGVNGRGTMFIKLGPKGEQVPIAVLIPNIITTLSLCSGLASIHYSLIEKWDFAVAAIALAMIFDMLDGRAARLLHVSSRFGAVLDSLSDFVSFGVAPAIILHEWLLTPAITPFELGAVMIYALCAGLRLARFTANVGAPKNTAPSNYFTGMPTPAAAAGVMIPALLQLSNAQWKFPQWGIMLLSITIALLMVSRVPTFAYKKFSISRQLTVLLMVLMGVLAVTLLTHFWLTLAVIASVNVLLTPVSWVMKSRVKTTEEGLKISKDVA